jgi:hypothetical protein
LVGAEESVLSVSSGPAGVRRPTAGFCTAGAPIVCLCGAGAAASSFKCD